MKKSGKMFNPVNFAFFYFPTILKSSFHTLTKFGAKLLSLNNSHFCFKTWAECGCANESDTGYKVCNCFSNVSDSRGLVMQFPWDAFAEELNFQPCAENVVRHLIIESSF